MSKNMPGHNANACVEIDAVVDFSKLNSGSGLASAGVHAAIALPANTLVLAVGFEVIEPPLNLDDMDIGDGTDPDGWIDGADVTLGNSTEGLGIFPTTRSKLYTSADTIDVVNNNAATVKTGVVRVWAACIGV